MNVIIDENLSPRLKGFFTTRNCRAWHVSDLRLAGRPDREVWREVCARSAVLVTQDSDFDAFAAEQSSGRLLRLTLGNAPNIAVAAWLADRWSTITAELEAGATVVVV